MAGHVADDGGNDIYVYRGGRVPQHLKNIITHARIDESITDIDDEAFRNCPNLQSVDFHPGVKKIGKAAFMRCSRLRSIKLTGVKLIYLKAFWKCSALANVEFGNELRNIGSYAFYGCVNIESLDISSVRAIEGGAFQECVGLTYVAFGDKLERIKGFSFEGCTRLRFITLPLKDGVIKDSAFNCQHLERVDLAGSVHKIVSSLHLESWRVEMNAEIHHINKVLPATYSGMKTRVIQQWVQLVARRFGYFKVQHYRLLVEAMTLLELALWKAKLDEKVDSIINDDSLETKLLQLSITNGEDARRECRITCGADVVIKNVLPFLTLPSQTS